MEHEVSKGKGINITEIRARELEKLIQDLSDDKSELETLHLKMRADCRSASEKLRNAERQAEANKALYDSLSLNNRDEQSKKLIEIS